MADNQDVKKRSVVTLQEAQGNPARIGPEPTKPRAMVHADAMVKTDLPRPKEGLKAEKLTWYHLGVLPGSPHQTVHVNGICFTLAAETVLIDRETRTTERSKRRGDMIKLSAEDFEKTVQKVQRKVIRWENKATGRGHIENMDKDGFVQESGDEPLGRYLFLKPVDSSVVDAALNPLISGGAESMELVQPAPEAPEAKGTAKAK